MPMMLLNPTPMELVMKQVKGKALTELRATAKKAAKEANEDISGAWPKTRIAEVLTRLAEQIPTGQLTVGKESGPPAQRAIRGIVTMRPISTEPGLSAIPGFEVGSQSNPFITLPAQNPPLQDDIVAASAAIVAASSTAAAAKYLEKQALPMLQRWLTKDGVLTLENQKRADLFANLIGTAGAAGTTALEVMASRWVAADYPEIEKGVIVGGIISTILRVAAKFLPDFYKWLKFTPNQQIYYQEGTFTTPGGEFEGGQIIPYTSDYVTQEDVARVRGQQQVIMGDRYTPHYAM